MYICMIYMYLTKQVNRLKLVRLPTVTSDLPKLYTIDKFGAEHAKWLENKTINSIIYFGMPIVT